MPGSVWTGYTAPQNNAIWLQALMQGMRDLGQVAQQYQGDQQANKIMNTENAPRAALVEAPSQVADGGTPIAAGSGTTTLPQGGMESASQWGAQHPNVPITGSQPFSGGMRGMEMQMALNKQNQTSASAQLEQQLKQFQMANMASEMQARTKSGNWNYPAGTNRYTPTAKQTANQNNQWGINSSLLDSNGRIPEATAKDWMKLNQDNAEFKTRYGVDMQEFASHDSGWTQNPDGTWQNNSFAGKHGPLVLPNDELTAARINAQKAVSTYKTYKALGYGPAMDKLIEMQGAQRNAAFQQPNTSPQAPVAGQTGKNSPLTGSQYINQVTGPNNSQTTIGSTVTNQMPTNPLMMAPPVGTMMPQ